MARLHFAERTIELHVAYFGPPQAGCGTNVRHLHRVVPAREKAELKRVGASDRKERMWEFTYHPNDPPKVTGFEVGVKLCSVPAGTSLQLDRDAMLAGIDGIVFVADARAGKNDENLAALLDLEQLLARQGHDLGGIPMVFQVNQLDAQSARPAERVVEELNPFGFPVREAMARQGKGVLETHEAILDAVLARVRDNLQGGALDVTVTAITRAAREQVEDAILSHAAALPQSRRPMPPTFGVPTTAEIPVRLAELRGSRPVQHVRTEVKGERLRVEGVFRRADGTHRKLALLLEAGADEATAPLGARRDTSAPPAPPPPPIRRWADSEDIPGDFSRLSYGVAGLLGGLVAGFLFRYVFFG